MRRISVRWASRLACLALVVGCSKGEHPPTAASTMTSVAVQQEPLPPPEAPSQPGTGPGWPGASPPGPPRSGESAPECEVELFSSVVEAPDGHWDVIARARNRTPRSLTLSLPKVCTGGSVEFAGISGYDYYGRCTQGACVRPPEGRSQIVVEPRAMVELGRGRVDPKGNSCNAPVPPGRYATLVAADLQGAVVCLGPAAVLDLNPGSPVTPPATPAPTQQPRKPREVKPIPPPKPCPPGPACGIACPGGQQKRDANGCTLCACEELRPSIAPMPQ